LLCNGFAAATIGRSIFFSAHLLFQNLPHGATLAGVASLGKARRHGCRLKIILSMKVFARKLVRDRMSQVLVETEIAQTKIFKICRTDAATKQRENLRFSLKEKLQGCNFSFSYFRQN